MARRRCDRWALGPALSLPRQPTADPSSTYPCPTQCSCGSPSPDRHLEVEGRVIAHTDRAVLVEWGFSQAAECA